MVIKYLEGRLENQPYAAQVLARITKEGFAGISCLVILEDLSEFDSATKCPQLEEVIASEVPPKLPFPLLMTTR